MCAACCTSSVFQCERARMYVCVCVLSVCPARSLVRHTNLTNPDMRTHTHTNGRRVKVGDSDVLCFRRSSIICRSMWVTSRRRHFVFTVSLEKHVDDKQKALSETVGGQNPAPPSQHWVARPRAPFLILGAENTQKEKKLNGRNPAPPLQPIKATLNMGSGGSFYTLV